LIAGETSRAVPQLTKPSTPSPASSKALVPGCRVRAGDAGSPAAGRHAVVL